VAVCISQRDGKPVPVPPDLREEIQEFMRG
jgi:acyl-CoA thioesterase FadM